MNNEFIIPLNGLAVGKNGFFWQADREFFVNFENTEILDAQLDMDAYVEKSGRYIGVDCDVWGDVTVECDRCLDELEMPVDVEIRLSVKYGNEEDSDEVNPGEREVIFVPETDADLDLGQIIYDYVCLSLPMQRCHDEGDCDPAAMAYLTGEKSQTDEVPADNPFAALKGLIG